MANASVSAAYNLICILGIPVAKPINVFEKSETQHKSLLKEAKRIVTKNMLLKKIFKRLARCNIRAATLKKAPFDFIINAPEQRMKIIGGVADDNETKLNKRIDEILSVSRIIQAHPILIVDEQPLSNKEISCIHSNELLNIQNPKDLIAEH